MIPRRPRAIVLVAALGIGMALILALTGALAPGSRQALGASTTLTVLGGDVDLRRGTAAFETAVDGDILQVGDAVRTGADGRAVLTYFEGSTVEIEPSSEVVIDAASLEPDASTIIVMTQALGHTWHVVSRTLGPTSRYEVRTPTATAAVRGTAFEVRVERDAGGELTTTVGTTEGAVSATRTVGPGEPRDEVVVGAGSQASVQRGRPIERPRPKPEPKRVVTVTIGSERSIVVDPLGRANGIRDGKLVLQTPGARVERLEGKLVITLPDIPDGKLATRVEREGRRDDDVVVEMRLRQSGGGEARIEERLGRSETGEAAAEFEVRGGERPEVRSKVERRGGEGAGRTAVPAIPLPTVPPLRTGQADDRGGPRATGIQQIPLPTVPPLTTDRGNPRASPTATSERRGAAPTNAPARDRTPEPSRTESPRPTPLTESGPPPSPGR